MKSLVQFINESKESDAFKTVFTQYISSLGGKIDGKDMDYTIDVDGYDAKKLGDTIKDIVVKVLEIKPSEASCTEYPEGSGTYQLGAYVSPKNTIGTTNILLAELKDKSSKIEFKAGGIEAIKYLKDILMTVI